MNDSNYDRSQSIRKMLLKTVGKDPDKFCYYANLLEAKQLVNAEKKCKFKLDKDVIDRLYNKKIIDC